MHSDPGEQGRRLPLVAPSSRILDGRMPGERIMGERHLGPHVDPLRGIEGRPKGPSGACRIVPTQGDFGGETMPGGYADRKDAAVRVERSDGVFGGPTCL